MNRDEFFLAVKDLGVSLTQLQLIQLNKYYKLLVEWNRVMNLTGITEEKDVYLKHFYDSITLLKVVDLSKEETLCDIGTGAGFPGLVLKIVFPQLKVTLVDSLQKRLNFLQVVINELGLTHIDLVHARAEDYAKCNREKYDVVTARAVAPINILIEYCLPLIKVNKYFISMKANISQEIKLLDTSLNKINGYVMKIEEFKLPIESSNRSLIMISKQTTTNTKFPRKNSEIKSKPL